MSLFGSLFTGVSGLSAETQRTSMIANNIANTNTVGYKRNEASFFSLVTTESGSAQFSPGTVSVDRRQNIKEQGAIQQTSSGTDAAISGNGFFPVKRSTDAGQEFLYTRAGSFVEDASGYLTNASGFKLYGWPIDTNGNLPANQGDLTSLKPVNVAFLGGLTRPTTSAALSINLDASQTPIDPHAQATAQELPVDNLPAQFSRGLTVFDSLGTAQTLSLEFRKIVGPMAHFTTNANSVFKLSDVIGDAAGPLPAMTPASASPWGAPGTPDGDAFSIDVDGTTETYYVVQPDDADVSQNYVSSIQDMIDAINAHGTGNSLEARISDSGRLLVQAVDPTATITLATVNQAGASDPLAGGPDTLNIVPDPGDGDLVFDPEAALESDGTANPDQTDFPDFAITTTPNTQGWWEMKIIHPDGTELAKGLLNFDGDGSLNAAADSLGNIDIELNNIDWGNGSSPQDIKVDVERFSQFSGNFDVISSEQNGAELGLRTGVELDRNGVVIARFSNGATTKLFQIPMVTFANANGLSEVSGTAFTKTQESGEDNLREAGQGGAGFLEPSTVEASNVDLADEFAKLIVSQRAFSANTRVINTVDQMTSDLLNLR